MNPYSSGRLLRRFAPRKDSLKIVVYRVYAYIIVLENMIQRMVLSFDQLALFVQQWEASTLKPSGWDRFWGQSAWGVRYRVRLVEAGFTETTAQARELGQRIQQERQAP